MSGYIGVNDKAKKIKSLYIGVNSKAKKVKSAYIGIDGVAKQWYPGIDTSNPNKRYNPKDLGTWNTTSDVDAFCNKYNHNNNYTGLGLGDYVTIKDGTYDIRWEIAGFDMEHNRTAADGSTYDNGYGICWIPKTVLPAMSWTDSYTTYTHGYGSSTMDASHLPTVINKLKTKLGDHLIRRNVLLSSSVSNEEGGTSSAYTWTTAYATLMSVGQMNGTFNSYSNKYDDGEAKYKLPLFNYESYKIGYDLWTRGIHHFSNTGGRYLFIWCCTSRYGYFESISCINEKNVRPLIYLR